MSQYPQALCCTNVYEDESFIIASAAASSRSVLSSSFGLSLSSLLILSFVVRSGLCTDSHTDDSDDDSSSCFLSSVSSSVVTFAVDDTVRGFLMFVADDTGIGFIGFGFVVDSMSTSCFFSSALLLLFTTITVGLNVGVFPSYRSILDSGVSLLLLSSSSSSVFVSNAGFSRNSWTLARAPRRRHCRDGSKKYGLDVM